VVDKLNQYIRQVVNDGRQNRPAVKVRPVRRPRRPKIAEALQGIIRHICDRSNADEAFDKALEDAATGGFGFFRMLTEYASERTFNQEMIVRACERARPACSASMTLLMDRTPRSGSSTRTFQKDDYKKQYPNAKVVDWTERAASRTIGSAEKTVRVVEYWYKVETPETLHLLEDGTVATRTRSTSVQTEGGQSEHPAD
jgi:hypothetical protein